VESAGPAIGAAGGGIAGSLIGLGIPELEAKQYETRVTGGNSPFSVHTENATERKQSGVAGANLPLALTIVRELLVKV